MLAGAAREIDGAGCAAGLDAIAVTCAARQVDLVIEANGLLGTGGYAGIAARAQVQVDRVAAGPADLEGTEPALEAVQPARDHRVAARLTAAGIARAFGPECDLQRVGQQVGRALGGVQRAQNQQTPLALVAHGGHRLRFGQACGRQQSGHLGRGLLAFSAPASALAQVDEADRRHRTFGLIGQFGKQALLLGAGDDHRVRALHGALKGARLAAAKGAVLGQRLTERLAQAAGLQRQGLVAVANQGGHVRGPSGRQAATVPQLVARAGLQGLAPRRRALLRAPAS